MSNRAFGQAGFHANAYEQNANVTAPQRVARVNNLWSEQQTVGNRQNSVVGTGIPLNQYGRGTYTNQGGSYTRLYPGSYGYNSSRYNDIRSSQGSYYNGQRNGNRSRQFRGRYSYYLFGNGYYPFVGGYGAYPGDTDLDTNYATLGQSYVEGGPTPDDGANQPPLQEGVVNPGAVTPPGAAQVVPSPGTQIPAGSQQPPAPASSRGPDSMVEAVQSELANRGYFKGKVNAMFGDDTKEAIRNFQKDNQLAVTGLLNNSTLVMLGLN